MSQRHYATVTVSIVLMLCSCNVAETFSCCQSIVIVILYVVVLRINWYPVYRYRFVASARCRDHVWNYDLMRHINKQSMSDHIRFWHGRRRRKYSYGKQILVGGNNISLVIIGTSKRPLRVFIVMLIHADRNAIADRMCTTEVQFW